MRLATWNVNSARARVDRIAGWLERSDVDVVALQETKCKDAQFPAERFEALGYEVAHSGFSQWNGVALLSRVGLSDVEVGFPGMPAWAPPAPPRPDGPTGSAEGDPPPVAPAPVHEARAIGATCGGVRVWSLYVPNGRGLDDPHLAYKLEWLEALRVAGTGWLAEDPDQQIALTGDFNVAPRDEDVWDMAVFDGSTHVTDEERAAFTGLTRAGFADVVRPRHPGPGVYTFWDYQQLRFPKKQGMRIDFVLASPALEARVTGASIDRDERKGKGASDHAPVIIDVG